MTESTVRFFRSAGARVCGSLLAASAAGFVAAFMDARWARQAAAEPPAMGSMLLASWGLIAPVALGVGLAAGVLAVLLHPARPPAPIEFARAIRDPAGERRAYAAVFFLAPVALAVWMLLCARMALAVLASEAAPAVAGAVLGSASIGLALLLFVLVIGGARALAGRFGGASPDPVLFGAAGLFVSVSLLGYAIASGTTSGGGGTFAMFGVLKRPELDLRAPALLLTIGASAYLLQGLAGRIRVPLALGIALVPLVFTLQSDRLDNRRIALGIERGAPLGKLLLAPLRKATDRDRDGFSARFGGGDCNDADPKQNPGADDVPGNGIDEDCSGSDAVALVIEKPRPAEPKNALEWMRAKLSKKLNVIFITIDTLRHDVGYMGYSRNVTPNLDRLAKKSVVFEKAYALASYTSKSLGPLLIGKYGSETYRGWSHFNRFGKEDIFLAQRLQTAGIRTISIQGYWYFTTPGHGFERGFDLIDTSASPKIAQVEGDRSSNSDKVSDAAIAQLAKPENAGRQFYAWIHYLDPHTEYVRHPEFDFGEGMRERYDSEVAFVDKHVGRVLDFIETSPFKENTAIVVTSDHGEAFNEHGMIRHGFELWEELVRVPLLFHVPGAEPRRIAQRRGHIDLVPTVLELTGVKPPTPTGTDFVSGESLVLDIFNPPGHEVSDRIVFIDMTAGPNNSERQSFIEKNLKLTTSGGRPIALFDLDEDPGEKQDLMDDKARSDGIVERFKAFRRGLRTVYVRPEPR